MNFILKREWLSQLQFCTFSNAFYGPGTFCDSVGTFTFQHVWVVASAPSSHSELYKEAII